MSGSHVLLMEFLDESHSFCHGFETGQLWERVKSGEIIESQPVHTENVPQIVRIMESFGCEHTITKVDEHWSILSTHSIINSFV